jgi:hypothetical protein
VFFLVALTTTYFADDTAEAVIGAAGSNKQARIEQIKDNIARSAIDDVSVAPLPRTYPLAEGIRPALT